MSGMRAMRMAIMIDLAIMIGMPMTTFLIAQITILNGKLKSVPNSAFSLELADAQRG